MISEIFQGELSQINRLLVRIGMCPFVILQERRNVIIISCSLMDSFLNPTNSWQGCFFLVADTLCNLKKGVVLGLLQVYFSQVNKLQARTFVLVSVAFCELHGKYVRVHSCTPKGSFDFFR